MPQFEIAAFVAVVAIVGVALYFLAMRWSAIPLTFESERDERLTRLLSQTLRCSLAAALSSLRTELRIAPDQTDETLLKRATYHYRRNLPEGSCSVYRDAKPG